MRDVSTWRLMVRLYGPWRKRLIFFALCVALGVGALFSVGNLLSVMTEHIGDRARTMLGGDVRISSWQRLDATARDHLNGALAEWPDAATTDTREDSQKGMDAIAEVSRLVYETLSPESVLEAA